jgi:hypothetical protein
MIAPRIARLLFNDKRLKKIVATEQHINFVFGELFA